METTRSDKASFVGSAEFKQALKTVEEIEVTVTGRSSGRTYSQPVWFVQEGAALYLLPVRGSNTDWYKNVVKNPTIRLTAKGIMLNARAKALADAAKVQEIVEKFRAKYGVSAVKKYYSTFDVAVEVPFS
jgi:deazaflavin-dependent oxidoreductase (nitroreductase family)